MRMSVFTGDINRTAFYWSFCAAYTFSMAAVAISSQTNRAIYVIFKDLFHFILQVCQNYLFCGATGRNWSSFWINSKFHTLVPWCLVSRSMIRCPYFLLINNLCIIDSCSKPKIATKPAQQTPWFSCSLKFSRQKKTLKNDICLIHFGLFHKFCLSEWLTWCLHDGDNSLKLVRRTENPVSRIKKKNGDFN